MSSSVVVLAIVGTLIAEKVVGPRLERLHPWTSSDGPNVSEHALTDDEKNGLRLRRLGSLGLYYPAACAHGSRKRASLRDPKAHTTLIPKSPFLSGIIPHPVLLLYDCRALHLASGKKVITKEADIAKYMGQGLAGVLSFIVTAFSAAQFIAWFK